MYEYEIKRINSSYRPKSQTHSEKEKLEKKKRNRIET
jgi:hypothetical protein